MDIDFDRVILSAPVICSKNDERYVFGCKRMDSNIAPLCVKSPTNCYSNEVSRYNENSTWKVGLDISNDKEWMKMYKAIWKEIEERLYVSLERVVRKDASPED